MRAEAIACIVVLGLALIALVRVGPGAAAITVAAAAVAAVCAGGLAELKLSAIPHMMDRSVTTTGGAAVPQGLFERARALRGRAGDELVRRLEQFIKRAGPGFEREASKLAFGRSGADDETVLTRLREAWLARNPVPRPPCAGVSAQSERARARIEGIPAFPELAEVRVAARTNPGFCYLDVGSGEGYITSAFAADLGLDRDHAFACDPVAQAEGAQDYTFVQSDGVGIPFPDGAFDLVTMFMSAHHFEDPSRMFAEAFRVARPGALLLLREHGKSDPSARLYYDLVHAFYEVVLTSPAAPEATPASFAARYARGPIAVYRVPDEWTRIVAAAGFVPVQTSRVLRDRFDSVYILFRRPP
jgi:SAM-dependent methyltransferase